MKRFTAAVGMTAMTAVVGMNAAPAVAAPSTGHAREVVVAPAEQAVESLRALIGGTTDQQTVRRNLEQRSVIASPQTFEGLVIAAAKQNDPTVSAAELEKILAAFRDLAKIIANVEPMDVERVFKGVTEAAMAVAEFQATGNLDAARRVLCGSGSAAAGSLAILSGVVRMYEASANLPQIAQILNVLDPRTPEGAKLFAALPEFARTPQVKAALVALSDIGRTLNEIDKQKVVALARDWAEAAARCDVSTVLKLPELMVRTFDMGREILRLLLTSRLGDLSAILSPAEAGRVVAVR
ncbi:hypothetical protein [Allokutzneria albata]|uniref:Uncharacterized protein n=1 Tax=Allokutzneria albata TaxID=211114 RepID=A0A1G9U3Q6_ALLAB|nr:hypothetical protein [Allokutzneria albata]SDM54587.1 hypothetical protein SAMN04489726_2158 [Allokutzneria albata]